MLAESTKILVIDDLSTIRSLIKNYLIDMGFHDIALAGDGREALGLLEDSIKSKIPYQLIISDWNMPKMTGLELLKICKQAPELRNIPVVFLTIEAEQKQILKAVSEGVSDYIVKPFTAEILKKKLENLSKKLGQ